MQIALVETVSIILSLVNECTKPSYLKIRKVWDLIFHDLIPLSTSFRGVGATDVGISYRGTSSALRK